MLSIMLLLCAVWLVLHAVMTYEAILLLKQVTVQLKIACEVPYFKVAIQHLVMVGICAVAVYLAHAHQAAAGFPILAASIAMTAVYDVRKSWSVANLFIAATRKDA